jgi:nitrate/nitrite-specific signal transduction histidine kinase
MKAWLNHPPTLIQRRGKPGNKSKNLNRVRGKTCLSRLPPGLGGELVPKAFRISGTDNGTFRQIEQSGLAAALKDLASRTGQRFGLVCTAKVDGTCRFQDTVLAVHLYRIAQEAASNAARHGHAKRIDIKVLLEGDVGILQIEDDGQGFSIEKKPNGLGLRTMEYRATVIKGTLKIDSKPGTGTVVTCSFPALAVK